MCVSTAISYFLILQYHTAASVLHFTPPNLVPLKCCGVGVINVYSKTWPFKVLLHLISIHTIVSLQDLFLTFIFNIVLETVSIVLNKINIFCKRRFRSRNWLLKSMCIRRVLFYLGVISLAFDPFLVLLGLF